MHEDWGYKRGGKWGGRTRFGQRWLSDGAARTQRMRPLVSGVEVVHEVLAVRSTLQQCALEG